MAGRTAAAGLLVAGLVGVNGCVTTPTARQTARTVEPQELRVSGGASLPISTRFIAEVSDLVDTAADRARDARDAGRPLTEEEQRELEESALALVLFTILPVFELDARYGIVDDFDVGLRYAGSSLRLDAKYRFLERDSMSLAGLLGYTYHFGFGTSVVESFHDLFEITAILDYTRHDVDAGVIVSGNENDTVVPYGMLRYLLAINSLELELDSSFDTETMIPRTELDPLMHVIAGTGGLRIGSEQIELLLELTLGYVILSPEVRGEQIDLGGFIITPALGLAISTG